jgi:hypothetical protein
VEGADAVGGIFALAGVALILWGITGRRVTVRDIGLHTAPEGGPGQLTPRQRAVLAMVFGVLLVGAGATLVLI